MQQSNSWESNQFSVSQEIPRILWNPKIHYRIHQCPPPVPIFSPLDWIHTPISYFLKIQLNIRPPSKPGSPKWPISLRFPHQNPVYASPLRHTCYMTRSSHSSRFYHPKRYVSYVAIYIYTHVYIYTYLYIYIYIYIYIKASDIKFRILQQTIQGSWLGQPCSTHWALTNSCKNWCLKILMKEKILGI
jgi:hypothetical protein